MIRRQRPVARGERRAAHGAQLLSVHLDRQAPSRRRFEHALALREREADALAKDVHRIDEAFIRERGQHPLADFVDVGIGAARELRR
jgi:hypothetical protein